MGGDGFLADDVRLFEIVFVTIRLNEFIAIVSNRFEPELIGGRFSALFWKAELVRGTQARLVPAVSHSPIYAIYPGMILYMYCK